MLTDINWTALKCPGSKWSWILSTYCTIFWRCAFWKFAFCTIFPSYWSCFIPITCRLDKVLKLFGEKCWLLKDYSNKCLLTNHALISTYLLTTAGWLQSLTCNWQDLFWSQNRSWNMTHDSIFKLTNHVLISTSITVGKWWICMITNFNWQIKPSSQRPSWQLTEDSKFYLTSHVLI